jgi:hypothetical protein
MANFWGLTFLTLVGSNNWCCFRLNSATQLSRLRPTIETKLESAGLSPGFMRAKISCLRGEKKAPPDRTGNGPAKP